MGARVYLPTLGRFLEPDPVPGGTPNGYVYVLDPVNFGDYSGAFLGIHIRINVNTVYRIAVGAVAVAGAVAVGLAVAVCVATVACGLAAVAAIGSLAAMTVAMGAIAVTGKPDNPVTNTALFVSTGLEVVSAAAGGGRGGAKASSSRVNNTAMQQAQEVPRMGGNIQYETARNQQEVNILSSMAAKLNNGQTPGYLKMSTSMIDDPAYKGQGWVKYEDKIPYEDGTGRAYVHYMLQDSTGAWDQLKIQPW